MTTAQAWLDRRSDGVPAALWRRACDSIAAMPDTADIAQDLYVAACRHLDSALNAGPQRAAADDLLVADAFFTWACEAAAEAHADLADRASLWVSELASKAAE